MDLVKSKYFTNPNFPENKGSHFPYQTTDHGTSVAMANPQPPPRPEPQRSMTSQGKNVWKITSNPQLHRTTAAAPKTSPTAKICFFFDFFFDFKAVFFQQNKRHLHQGSAIHVFSCGFHNLQPHHLSKLGKDLIGQKPASWGQRRKLVDRKKSGEKPTVGMVLKPCK